MSLNSRTRTLNEKIRGKWHTPGHKGTLSPLDLTELDFGQDYPGDSYVSAEKKVAAFYSSRHARLLYCGASMGIKAAVMAVDGDIAAFEGSHRSIYDGAALTGVEVVTVPRPRVNGLRARCGKDALKKVLDDNPQITAVVVESPDYYGFTAEEGLADFIKEQGKILIADSAHGAHFPAHEGLFPKGLSSIADMCALSAHKTMQAYTQSAYLCINNDALLGKVDRALRLLGSTSPSYLLLGALEDAVDRASGGKAQYDSLFAAVERFKQKVACVANDDFTRIVVDAGAYKITGHELFLRIKRLGEYAELYDARYVVFIATLADTAEDIDRLAEAIIKAGTMQ